jgi:hypothetical protein
MEDVGQWLCDVPPLSMGVALIKRVSGWKYFPSLHQNGKRTNRYHGPEF